VSYHSGRCSNRADGQVENRLRGVLTLHGVQEEPPRALPFSECRTLEEHVTACAARDAVPAGAQGADASDGHPSEAESAHAQSSRHRSAARALLAAARVADSMCAAACTPSLGEDAAAWLLRLPAQCTLGVLLARRGHSDAAADKVLPMFHSLGTLATPRPGMEEDSAAADAGLLWLQVRYLRATVHRATGIECHGALGNAECGSPPLDSPANGYGGPAELWAAYLITMLQLMASPSVSRVDAGVRQLGEPGGAAHAVYGTQHAAPEALLDAWMSADFVQALRSPGVPLVTTARSAQRAPRLVSHLCRCPARLLRCGWLSHC
jgi:hypothetical protein